MSSEVEIKNTISRLKSRAQAIPRFKVGDFVESKWHNEIVDILREMSNILDVIPVTKETRIYKIYVGNYKNTMFNKVTRTLYDYRRTIYFENFPLGLIREGNYNYVKTLSFFYNMVTWVGNTEVTVVTSASSMQMVSIKDKPVVLIDRGFDSQQLVSVPNLETLRELIDEQRYILALIQAFRGTTTSRIEYDAVTYPRIEEEALFFGILIESIAKNNAVNRVEYQHLLDILTTRWGDLTVLRQISPSQTLLLLNKRDYAEVADDKVTHITTLEDPYAEAQLYYDNSKYIQVDGYKTVPNVQSGYWVVDGMTYHYRVAIMITNNASTDLTDYQVRINVNTLYLVINGYSTSTGNEIRFTDSQGNTLPHWRETSYGLAETVYWVKVPLIPAGSTITIYMYFDPNLSNAPDASNGKNVFLIYEDMDTPPSGSLAGSAVYDSTNKWVRLTPPSTNKSGYLYYVINNLPSIEGFYIRFRLWVGNGNGADALWAAVYDTTYSGTKEDIVSGGYHFTYDEYQDRVAFTKSTTDNGSPLCSGSETTIDNGQWHIALVKYYKGCAQVYYDGNLKANCCDSGYSSYKSGFGNYIIFGARTGGLYNEHRIDDIIVAKYVSPEPTVIIDTTQVPVGTVKYGIISDEYTTRFIESPTKLLSRSMSRVNVLKSIESSSYHVRRNSEMSEDAMDGKPEHKEKVVDVLVLTW